MSDTRDTLDEKIVAILTERGELQNFQITLAARPAEPRKDEDT